MESITTVATKVPWTGENIKALNVIYESGSVSGMDIECKLGLPDPEKLTQVIQPLLDNNVIYASSKFLTQENARRTLFCIIPSKRDAVELFLSQTLHLIAD